MLTVFTRPYRRRTRRRSPASGTGHRPLPPGPSTCSAASPPRHRPERTSPAEDPGALAFKLNGFILAADANFVLDDDPAVLDLACQVARRRLGQDNDGNPGNQPARRTRCGRAGWRATARTHRAFPEMST
jgi:hypothetical protein